VLNLKLNSDDQTLAENKILILYILDKVGKPISHNELLELVISISDMNYFYFQQFLLDLLDDNYVSTFKKENDDIYELTEDGKNALIPVPPLAEQQRIVDKIGELMSIVDALKVK